MGVGAHHAQMPGQVVVGANGCVGGGSVGSGGRSRCDGPDVVLVEQRHETGDIGGGLLECIGVVARRDRVVDVGDAPAGQGVGHVVAPGWRWADAWM